MYKRFLAVLFIFASLASNAQVVNVTELMNKNSDDLASYFISEHKKRNIKLDDLDDKTGLVYDEKGNKTKAVSEYYKWLFFDNASDVEIISDKDDKPYSFTFDFGINEDGPANRTVIKKNLGIENWQMVSVTDNDTTYRKGDMYASVFMKENNIEGDLVFSPAIFIYKASPYKYEPVNEKKFDISQLSSRDNAADLGYSLIFYMKNMGVNFLYTDGLKPIVNENETASQFVQKYYFTEGAYFVITSGINGYLKAVTMNLPDPLGFSKMKKNLGIATWEKSDVDYPEKDEEGTRYRQKNTLADINQEAKRIVLNIQPGITDLKTRYEMARSGLSFLELYTIWSSHDNLQQLEKYITPRFLNKADASWKNRTIQYYGLEPTKHCSFFIKSTGDSLVMCRFYKKPDIKNTAVMTFFSRDQKYITQLYNELKASEYTEYYTTDLSPAKDDKSIYFLGLYDKGLVEERTEAIRQEEQEELAEKNRKAQERENLRYEKQQRDAQNIQKYGNILSNYLKSRN
jgi:hypothetical protein